VTNYLNTRYCQDGQTDRLCHIIAFNDDEFSHWVFFVGFIIVSASILVFQALAPSRELLRGVQLALVVVNGLIISLGIFANLALEEVGLDLPVVGVMLGIAALLWRRYGAQPLFVHSVVAYGVGLTASVLCKAAS
jgi:hypothetical protein